MRTSPRVSPARIGRTSVAAWTGAGLLVLAVSACRPSTVDEPTRGPAAEAGTDACVARWTLLDDTAAEPDVTVDVMQWVAVVGWDDPTHGAVRVHERLHMAPGESLRVRFQSVDVQHALALPDCGPDVRLSRATDNGPGAAVDVQLEGLRDGEVHTRCLRNCGSEADTFRLTIAVGAEPTRPDVADAMNRPPPGMTSAEWGATIAQQAGCLACHSPDGMRGVGPSLQGVYQSTRPLEGGGSIVADRDYLRRAFLDPGAEIVEGYPNVSPSYEGRLRDAEVEALLDWLESL
jgi:cytochrome c oxidase subunit 2